MTLLFKENTIKSKTHFKYTLTNGKTYHELKGFFLLFRVGRKERLTAEPKSLEPVNIFLSFKPFDRENVKPWNRETVKPWNRETVKPWNRETVKPYRMVYATKDLKEELRTEWPGTDVMVL
jgi:hypothetical protein